MAVITMERITPPDTSRQERISAAFAVLRAARDLGDVPTQLTTRRAIEAYLEHREPRASDLIVISRYFG